MNGLEYAGIGLVALNVAIAEGCKRLGLHSKLTGVISVLAGIVEGVFLIHPTDLKSGLVVGLALGLSGVGLFSTSKNLNEFRKEG